MCRDYELTMSRRVTMAEVFNANDGKTIALRVFTGLFHQRRARFWARWNSRPSIRFVEAVA